MGEVNVIAGSQYPSLGRPKVDEAHVSRHRIDHQVRIRVAVEPLAGWQAVFVEDCEA